MRSKRDIQAVAVHWLLPIRVFQFQWPNFKTPGE
jgi:hypothetical protein